MQFNKLQDWIVKAKKYSPLAKLFSDAIINNYPSSNPLENLAKSNELEYKRFLMQYLNASELDNYLSELNPSDITMIHFDMERHSNNIFNPDIHTLNVMWRFISDNFHNPLYHFYITYPGKFEDVDSAILSRVAVINYE